MPTFRYRALTAAGQSVEGVLSAENYQVALRHLDEQQLHPVKVAEGAHQPALSLTRGGRIKTHHLTRFYSQLADLLKAGVPLLRSLDVLSRQSHGALTTIIREVREDVAGGVALGEAMAKHPSAFSPLHASMVKAGEQGGFLEDVLHRIAIFSEKQDELRNKMIGSMIYPCILVTVGIGVVAMLMAVVVPKIRGYLRPESYNVMTKIVFALCDVLRDHYLLIILGIVAVITAFVTAIRTERGRLMWEKFKLKAPVLGPVITMVSVCRFCRILGTLLHNGVPILQSLSVAKDSAGNKVLSTLIENAGESVRKGASLSQPLGESGLFPPDIVDMIAVAEESNNLETVLVQIAETNEARTGRQIELAVRVIEPLLLIFMALNVFCVLAALLVPILTMGSVVE